MSRRDRLIDTAVNSWHLVRLVHLSVVEYARDVRSLCDKDIQDALATILATYQSEVRGVIYQHRTPNLLAQSLVNSLFNRLDEAKKALDKDGGRLSSEELASVFELLVADVAHQVRQSEDGRLFLKTLIRTFPAIYHAPRKEQGGIILASS